MGEEGEGGDDEERGKKEKEWCSREKTEMEFKMEAGSVRASASDGRMERK